MIHLKSFVENLSDKEIIEEIKEISENIIVKGCDNSTSGYSIITNKQTIKLLIDDEQSCCEKFGYLISNDDFSDFIGSQLINISTTDTCLKTQKIEKIEKEEEILIGNFPDDEDYSESIANTVFVNINTSKGILQFTAYNAHNGYYGHGVYIISDKFKFTKTI